MLDTQKIAPYYNEIANLLDETIPAEWSEIVMYSDQSETSFNAFFYYKRPGEDDYIEGAGIPTDYSVSEKIYLNQICKLASTVRSLWKEFIQCGEKPWVIMVFRLNSDFKCNADFRYEIDNEIGPMEQEVRWAYDELGYIPPEGSFSKFLLEKYLENKK